MSTSQTNSVTWAWQYVDYVSITYMSPKKKRVSICGITLSCYDIYGKHQRDDIAPEKKLILLVYFVILAACLLKGNMNQDFAFKWLSISHCSLVAFWFYVQVFAKSLLASFPDLIYAVVGTDILGLRNDCLDLWKDNCRQYFLPSACVDRQYFQSGLSVYLSVQAITFELLKLELHF